MDGHHIVPANQKLMRYEDLKIHIAEVERCQKHTQTNLSLQYFSRKISEKMKPCNSNLGIANARASQTTSTSSPSMCISSPHLHQFRHDLQQQAIPEIHPDSRLFSPISTRNFFQGHMEVDRKWQNEFWQNLQLTQYLLGWSDLLMQDHTFLRHSME